MEKEDSQLQELQQLLLLDQIRRNCEANYAKNPFDADNLTKWGGVLLQMSQYGDVQESQRIIKDAISKLEQAIEMNPRKHEAFWCLGNAHTSEAFFTFDPKVAQGCFERATESFQKAVKLAPQNETYLNALETSIKAPAMHKEVQEGFARQTQKGGSSASPNSSKKEANSDLKYDIGGWIVLAVGLIAWVATEKSALPPAS